VEADRNNPATHEDRLFRGNQQLTLAPGETLAQDCAANTCKACVLVPNQVTPLLQSGNTKFFFQGYHRNQIIHSFSLI
jgi:hypothetical protein